MLWVQYIQPTLQDMQTVRVVSDGVVSISTTSLAAFATVLAVVSAGVIKFLRMSIALEMDKRFMPRETLEAKLDGLSSQISACFSEMKDRH